MIEVKELTKTYGNKNAVDNITFNVSQGQIVGFLGPNGAGKTTTMNIITGYISSSSGSAVVDGFNVLENPNEVKKRIGYLPEQPPLYLDMIVSEYLDFVYNLKKIKLPDKKKHIEEILELVKIQDVKDRLIANLSKGYRQRVGVAQALIGSPKILILDEPTVGLDPVQIIEMRNVIKGLKGNHTIILSSHILAEISAVCEDVIIINKGKIVRHGCIADMTRMDNLELKVLADNSGKLSEILSEISGVTEVSLSNSSDSETLDANIQFDKDIRKELFYALAKADMPIYKLNYKALTLEDVFIQATKENLVDTILDNDEKENLEEGSLDSTNDIEQEENNQIEEEAKDNDSDI